MIATLGYILKNPKILRGSLVSKRRTRRWIVNSKLVALCSKYICAVFCRRLLHLACVAVLRFMQRSRGPASERASEQARQIVFFSLRILNFFALNWVRIVWINSRAVFLAAAMSTLTELLELSLDEKTIIAEYIWYVCVNPSSSG